MAGVGALLAKDLLRNPPPILVLSPPPVLGPLDSNAVGLSLARLVTLSIYYLSRAGSWELGCPGYLDLQYIPGLLSLRAPYYYPRRVQLRKETPQREAPSFVPHASFGCSFTLRIHGELSCRYDTRAGSFHRA